MRKKDEYAVGQLRRTPEGHLYLVIGRRLSRETSWMPKRWTWSVLVYWWDNAHALQEWDAEYVADEVVSFPG